jgi:hypothetical protein
MQNVVSSRRNLDDLFSSKNIKVYPGFGIRFIHKIFTMLSSGLIMVMVLLKMLTMELYLELPIFLRGLLNIFFYNNSTCFHRMT